MPSREFNELDLMINVMLEDSQWLDSFQEETLDRQFLLCSERHESKKPEACAESAAQGKDKVPNRKRPCCEQATPDLTSIAGSPVIMESQNLEGSIQEKRARNTPARCCISEMQAIELPAPEFIIGNRSSIAAETIRIFRSAIVSHFRGTSDANDAVFFKSKNYP